jgi:hypothetical protein
MTSTRFRLRQTFWLDLNREDEKEIAEQVAILKENRTFVKTVRDGIRLICDLRKGQVDVLFELFPWVKAEFLAGIQPQETAGERALREHLERIERQLLSAHFSSGTVPNTTTSVGNPKTLSGPKPLNVQKFDLPTFDDDDLDTLVIKKDTSTDSAQNFINSLMRLQQ